jgi:fatty acid desaturase
MTDNSPNSTKSNDYESAVKAIEAIVKQPTIELKVDFGISKVLSVLTMAWWFAGIAVAPWFWWKLAACIPPVGMIIAVDRALTVYAPGVMAPTVVTPELQSPATTK